MNYKVGQVLFVVLKKEQKVYPMQVVEEITKRTLQGAEMTYMVRAGTDPKSVVSINDIDGEVFDTSEKARATLVDRATRSINRLVDVAVQKAKEWYPGSFEVPTDDVLSVLKKTPEHRVPGAEVAELAAEFQSEVEEGNATVIELPDGRQARVRQVKLPDALK